MIAAVVLAAGASSRFGFPPKQRLLVPGVLQRLAAAPSVGEVVVVAGAHELEIDARVVGCPDWERGPGASLRCGLRALPAATEAAVVVLGDGPRLNPAAIERLVADWRGEPADLVAASYAGVRGHPVLVSRRLWARIPDEGLRALVPRLVACDDLGAPGDVDHPADVDAGEI